MKEVHSTGLKFSLFKLIVGLGGLLIGVGHLNAELAGGLWDNPVLATADGVIGPLTEIAKTTSKIIFDYSVLTASVSIQDYEEEHVQIRGTTPFPTKTVIRQHHYLDPVDNKTSVWESFSSTTDLNGNLITSPASNATFKHGVGNASWKCEARNADGSLAARSELFVKPTRMRVTVDVGRYAN